MDSPVQLQKLYMLARRLMFDNHNEEYLGTLLHYLTNVYNFSTDCPDGLCISDALTADISAVISAASRMSVVGPTANTQHFADSAAQWSSSAHPQWDGMHLEVRFDTLRELIRTTATDHDIRDVAYVLLTGRLSGASSDLSEVDAGWERTPMHVYYAMQDFVEHESHHASLIPSYWLMRFADGAPIWTHSPPIVLNTGLNTALELQAMEPNKGGNLVYLVLLIMQAHASDDHTTQASAIAAEMDSHQSGESLHRIHGIILQSQSASRAIDRARDLCTQNVSVRKLHMLAQELTGPDMPMQLLHILRQTYDFKVQWGGPSDTDLQVILGAFITHVQAGDFPVRSIATMQFTDDAPGWKRATDGMSLPVRFNFLRALVEVEVKEQLMTPMDVNAGMFGNRSWLRPILNSTELDDDSRKKVIQALQEFVEHHRADVPPVYIPSYWLMRFADGAALWRRNW